MSKHQLSKEVLNSILFTVNSNSRESEIIRVYKSSQHFALKNHVPKSVVTGQALCYLNVCETAEGHDVEYGHACAKGLKSILWHQQSFFRMKYPPYHHPNGLQRWFLRQIVSMTYETIRRGALITHFNITRLKKKLEKK